MDFDGSRHSIAAYHFDPGITAIIDRGPLSCAQMQNSYW